MSSKFNKTYVFCKKSLKSFGLFCYKHKKHPAVKVFALLVGLVAFSSDIKSLLGIGDIDPRQIIASVSEAISTSQNALQNNINPKLDEIRDDLEQINGIDCSSIDKEWISDDNSINFYKQYLILQNGVNIGSARFIKKFSNLFILDFVFLPTTLSNADVTISLKDNAANELSLTIGNSRTIRSIYKKNGVLGESEPQTFRLSSDIDASKEIKLRIQSIWKPKITPVSASMEYALNKKTDHPRLWEEVMNRNLPNDYIGNGDVNLNIGMKSSNANGQEKNIKLMVCSIQETKSPN